MSLIRTVMEGLAPMECLRCGREGNIVCRACEGLVAEPTPTVCYRCNRLSEEWMTCRSCRRRTPLSAVSVAGHYAGALQVMIQAFKYEQVQSADGPLGRMVAGMVPGGRYDVVTGVPAATGRVRARGYNQAELMGRVVARELDLPYLNLLVRLNQAQQVGADMRQRFEQTERAMVVRRRRMVDGRRVLVVDDVMTTGATLEAVGRALKEAGAKTVGAAVAARH